MIRMKSPTGTELTIDGTEDLAVLGQIRDMFTNDDNINRMRLNINRIRKDLSFVVRQFASARKASDEKITLKGTRRLQFDWVKEYLKADHDASIYLACKLALDAIQGEDGYQSLKALHRYCCDHRMAFIDSENPVAATGR